jgi:hypothetical protein
MKSAACGRLGGGMDEKFAMATTIRSAIDGVAFQLEANSKLDLKAYANELVILFDMATHKSAR